MREEAHHCMGRLRLLLEVEKISRLKILGGSSSLSCLVACIRGRINARMLSSNTTYGVYLVFKLDEGCYGLNSANAVFRFADKEKDAEAERRARVVYLHLKQHGELPSRRGELPSRRSDGWMEIQLGSFDNGTGDDGEAEGRLLGTSVPKSGLIVEGIEFRPMI